MSKEFNRACFYSVLILIAGIIIPASNRIANGSEEDVAKAMVEKADRIRFPQGGYQVNVKITSQSPGRDAEIRDYEILSKGNDRTIIRTLSPASDKGQVLLMRDRDLWIFMPSVSQPIRLSAGQRLTGQVANGDLARANFAGDYTPSLIRTDTIENESFYVLELKAVDRSVTYDRVVYWIAKNSDRPYKAEFYALSGRLLKTCHFQNYKESAGLIRPTRLVMEDALIEGAKSVLDYSELKTKELADKIFAKDYMRRFQ